MLTKPQKNSRSRNRRSSTKGWRFLFSAATLLALAGLIFSSGYADRRVEKALTRITIAFQDWVGYGPFYLGAEKGFFKEEGLDLVFVDEQLDAARRDAFKQGMLDCEAGTLDLLVSKRASGVPIQSVMQIDESFGSDGIVASRDIRTLDDLAGKKVALVRDDVGETFLSYLFYKKGLPFDKLIIIPESPQHTANAFIGGKADAVVTWEPDLSRSLKRPGAHILTSSRENPGIIIDMLNVREDLIRKDPRLVKALMRGWFRAVTYYNENPVESSGIIAPHFGMTPEGYRRAVEGLRWTAHRDQLQAARYQTWEDVFNTIAEIKFLNGRIRAKPDAKSAIDSSLVKGLYEDSK